MQAAEGATRMIQQCTATLQDRMGGAQQPLTPLTARWAPQQSSHKVHMIWLDQQRHHAAESHRDHCTPL